MGKTTLAGNYKGGHKTASVARVKNVKPFDTGTNGRGTMPFTSTMHDTARKDIVGGTGERMPMKDGIYGRVLYSSQNKNIGRQEGTGKAS